jgi:hypothetical protein
MAWLSPNESFVDRIVREAIARGEFDDLPGTGKPLPGEGTIDGEGWWIRRWITRSRIDEPAQGPTVPHD